MTYRSTALAIVTPPTYVDRAFCPDCKYESYGYCDARAFRSHTGDYARTHDQNTDGLCAEFVPSLWTRILRRLGLRPTGELIERS